MPQDRRRLREPAGGLFALILAGCQMAAPVVPSPSDGNPGRGTPQAAGTAAASAGAPRSHANEGTLTVRAVESFGFGFATTHLMSNDDVQFLQPLMMSTLYRYDDRLRPVPDLAATLCAVDDDGEIVTCTLRDARFHDGTPVAADDVQFSFELVAAIGHPVLLDRFESAAAIDERTVQFRLPRPDPTFEEALAFQVIVSRDAYEAAYNEVAAAAQDLPDDAADAAASIGARVEEMIRATEETADCSGELSELDRLLDDAPDLIPPDAAVVARIPWFDDTSCDRAFWTAFVIESAVRARKESGVAAIAEAHIAVHLRVPRLGSGPFRLVREEPGSVFEFEAYERHHHGRPALDRVHVQVIPDEAEAIAELRRGAVDMLIPIAFDPGVDALRYAALRDEPHLTIAEFAEPAYVALMLNVRAGQLFEQVELRQALRLCLDKAALVDAATNGTGIALEGPLLPTHWAYHPDLVAPDRNVGAARELIESVGWAVADDGVYARHGRRLTAEIWVRADREDRVRFVELVAERARDCGMDLRPGLADFDQLQAMVVAEPHLAPERTEPFDVFFGGWSTSFEPHDAFDVFHSGNIPVGPAGDPLNFIGYRNERFDALLEQASATHDQRERARLYGELQTILAEEQPYVFAWAFWMRAYFTSDLVSESGPLNLASPLWNWEVEKLNLRR